VLAQSGPAFCQDACQSTDSPQGSRRKQLCNRSILEEKMQQPPDQVAESHPEKRGEWDTCSNYTTYIALSNLPTGESNCRELTQDIPK